MGGDDDEGVDQEGLGFELLMLGRLAHKQQVRLIVFEAFNQPLAVGDLETDPYLGVSAAKFSQQSDGEVVDGVGDRDLQPPEIGPFHLLDQGFCFFELMSDAPAQLVQFFSRLGQVDFLAQPFKKGEAHRVFKLLDLHRDGGLG